MCAVTANNYDGLPWLQVLGPRAEGARVVHDDIAVEVPEVLKGPFEINFPGIDHFAGNTLGPVAVFQHMGHMGFAFAGACDDYDSLHDGLL